MNIWVPWVQRLADQGLAGAEKAFSVAQTTTGDALRTVRFLRGRQRFQARDEDIYVATYPRSGTTWLQYILHLLKGGADDFTHLSEVSPWWERCMALGYTSAERFELYQSPRVFKSHLPRQWLPQKGRFIYSVRDGLDVAVSYHMLYRSHLRFSGDFSEFYQRFLNGEVQYGSWFKHVEGWRRVAHEPNVQLVSYEDLQHNFVDTVANLCRFLGWSVSPDKLTQVEARASFPAMKAQEKKFDPITETLMHQGLYQGHFLRQGTSGEGKAVVTEAMRAKFEAACSVYYAHPEIEFDLPAFLH
ncbi:MAG: sulfotransferase domain-containing protein [Myxococcales bacterium]|nr:sulfotransferase domain-containing protein [Myxococcales bacterium]